MKNPQSKILVIVGPTSSGKSELAVKLAKRFNGEIISCDSRQIYKGMDLGTGKIPGRWKRKPTSLNHGRDFNQFFVYKGITHYCIDYINPKSQYSAALFQRDAKKAIADVEGRGKLPILCGGTAHWIDAVVNNQQLPDIKPNPKLRKQLEKQSADALFKRLRRLDPIRAKSIDKFNKHRLIRALEIVIISGKPVPSLPLFSKEGAGGSYFDALWLGVNPPQNILYDKIKKRLKQRFDQGMVKEVARLHHQGLSWKKLESFGLEYKFVSLYLQKKLTRDEMFELLFTAIKQYTKRQMTWWKRNKDIKWINNLPQAQKLTNKFLK